jgi:hypothetical protein
LICPKCGSKRLKDGGPLPSGDKPIVYYRYECLDCGEWLLEEEVIPLEKCKRCDRALDGPPTPAKESGVCALCADPEERKKAIAKGRECCPKCGSLHIQLRVTEKRWGWAEWDGNSYYSNDEEDELQESEICDGGRCKTCRHDWDEGHGCAAVGGWEKIKLQEQYKAFDVCVHASKTHYTYCEVFALDIDGAKAQALEMAPDEPDWCDDGCELYDYRVHNVTEQGSSKVLWEETYDDEEVKES